MLMNFWPEIVSGVLGLAGIFFGLFKHQQTKTANSNAALSAIKAKNAIVEADSAKQALAKHQDATIEAAQTEKTVSELSSSELDKEFHANDINN